MSSHNLPSFRQSLFHDQLSRLFALHWNIPGSCLDKNRSLYNFKPSYSLLTLRVSWCDVCTDFTNVIKVDVDVDVNEMSLLNI